MISLRFSPKVAVLTGAFLLAFGVVLGSAAPQDMVVTSVSRGSPAEAAGMMTGDIIVSVDGTALATQDQLAATVNRKRVGDTVDLFVQAPGQAQPKEMIMNLARKSPMDAAPWLGVDVSAAGQQGVTSAAVIPATGAYVASVEAGSPAGLVAGDLILSLNGTALDVQHQLVDAIDQMPIGQLVSLSVLAAGQTQPMDVRLNVARRSMMAAAPWIGVTVSQSYGAAVTLPVAGDYVASVDISGPAEMAGLTPGDVILSVDGTALDAQHQLGDIIDRMRVGDPVTLSVEVPGQTAAKDLTVTLERNPDKAANPWLGVDVASSASTTNEAL